MTVNEALDYADKAGNYGTLPIRILAAEVRRLRSLLKPYEPMEENGQYKLFKE